MIYNTDVSYYGRTLVRKYKNIEYFQSIMLSSVYCTLSLVSTDYEEASFKLESYSELTMKNCFQ